MTRSGRDTHPSRAWVFVLAALVAVSGLSFSALSVWARNYSGISTPLRLIQLIALELALSLVVIGVVAKRGGDLIVAAMTLSLGGLLFGASDPIAEALGTASAWVIVIASTAACGFLMKRASRSSRDGVRTLAAAFTFFLLLQPPLSILLDRDVGTTSVTPAAPLPVAKAGDAGDVLLVVLDAYASLKTLHVDLSFESPMRDVLLDEGFQVFDSAWSPSTNTSVSIASLTNIGVPIDSKVSAADEVALLDLIRGDGRLFSMFQAAGYTLSYVESGWLGSVCSATVDVCLRRSLIDEAIQVVVDRSLIGNPAEGWWGHAFALGGVRSLSMVAGLIHDLGSNDENDFVFAHVMLPHEPYVLAADCQTTGVRVFDHDDRVRTKGGFVTLQEAYVEQLKCVDVWIERIAQRVAPGTAVAIIGDHGTTFRGQMTRGAATWSAEDIRERASVFLALKVPSACGMVPITGSLEAVIMISDCLLGTQIDRGLTDIVWLLGSDGLPRCVRQPRRDSPAIDIDCPQFDGPVP